MRKNNKIICGAVILLLGLSSIFLIFNKKEEYKELPKVKIKNSIKNKPIALMVEQINGEYAESQEELPTDGYIFNKTKSNCIDTNGKIISNAIDYDYENYIVTLNISKTSYCYLYYDMEPNIKYLRSKDTDNHLTSNLAGGMYRYQGLYTDDVRNYICLGTDCSEYGDDLYRIIGVTSFGELKVMKKTALKDALQWNTDVWQDIKWNESNAFHQLNDSEDGTMYKDTSFYSTLNPSLKAKIQTKKWLFGETSLDVNASELYDADNLYLIESGLKPTIHTVNNNGFMQETYTWDVNKDFVVSPISLIYIHDYLYSYPGGKPGNYNDAKNCWMHITNNIISNPENTIYPNFEWTMVREGYITSGIYISRYIGAIGVVYSVNTTDFMPVRPVFYLTKDINLSGDGTLIAPFKIF